MTATDAKRIRWIAAALLALTVPVILGAELARPPAPQWRSFHGAFEPGDGSAPDHPPESFASGRKGRALRVGRGDGPPELAQQGVVDLSRPGAITLWMRQVDWQEPGPTSDYVPVIRVLGSGPAALIVERDRRNPGRTVDVWIAGYFSLASRGDVQMQRELSSLWSEDAWHFLVFQWDATGFSLQLDDSPPARIAMPATDVAAEFPKATSKLVIGSGAREGLLVDDLSVWSRPLESRELKALRAN